jgi:hypothetical protein
MPILIFTVVAGFAFGYLVRPAALSYLLTALLTAFSVGTVVWALADNKGNDPIWLLAPTAVLAIAAFGVTHYGVALRERRA